MARKKVDWAVVQDAQRPRCKAPLGSPCMETSSTHPERREAWLNAKRKFKALTKAELDEAKKRMDERRALERHPGWDKPINKSPEPSQSVRTVSGGLPTLGKRR